MSGKSASVRQRLLNKARSESVDFQRILTRYGIERLLARLSQSSYRADFTVKGAVLFTVWLPETLFHRATKDLDLLGHGDPAHQRMRDIFEELCKVEVEDDGLLFDPASIQIDEIKPDDAYNGVRIKLIAHLGTTKIFLQVDVGFGDAISPEAVSVSFPSLLDNEEPKVMVYPKETVIAEKFQAMVFLGEHNSRMKDFFDIYILSEKFDFQGESLAEAIAATFHRRDTEIPKEVPVALGNDFIALKSGLWSAFVRKSEPSDEKLELAQVIEKVRSFLLPVCRSITNGAKLGEWEWSAGGPWSDLDNPQ